MRNYIIKRILLIIPSLLFIVIISFILLNYSPGDPVQRVLNNQETGDLSPGHDGVNNLIRRDLINKLGLDLPVFYFSFSGEEKNNSAEKNKYIPHIYWHPDNRFHNWFFGDGINTKGIIHGDFGKSWVSGENISEIIRKHIGWSLFFTLFSVLLAYLVSKPAGIYSAARPGSKYDRTFRILFSIFFSLPSFWVATLLMFTFCNPEMINVLPSSGIGPLAGFDEGDSFLFRIIHIIPYLILPTICYTYSSFAFISANIRASMINVLQEDYIRTARAKGLSEKDVLYKHAWRNSLLPAITIFSQIFPAVIGGSVIIETIFSIPGMGLTIFQGISSLDYPLIIAVFMITGIFTLAGFLVTDIVYALADPRISFQRKYY
jgi:peptide/nickel transport system permease protein